MEESCVSSKEVLSSRVTDKRCDVGSLLPRVCIWCPCWITAHHDVCPRFDERLQRELSLVLDVDLGRSEFTPMFSKVIPHFLSSTVTVNNDNLDRFLFPFLSSRRRQSASLDPC